MYRLLISTLILDFVIYCFAMGLFLIFFSDALCCVIKNTKVYYLPRLGSYPGPLDSKPHALPTELSGLAARIGHLWSLAIRSCACDELACIQPVSYTHLTLPTTSRV